MIYASRHTFIYFILFIYLFFIFIERALFWIDEIRKHSTANVTVLLVATKVDLVNDRRISYDELQAFAREYNVPFIETSSKTNQGVFQAVYMAMKMKLYQLSTNPTTKLPTQSKQQEVKTKKNHKKCLLS